MGTCLGHCFNSNSRRHDRCHLLYGHGAEYIQFDQDSLRERIVPRRLRLPHCLSSILFLKRTKELQREVTIELVENSWTFECCDGESAQPYLSCCNHIEPSSKMQPELEFETLDAKALLVPQKYLGLCLAQENKSLNPTPPSSIDLEWEHEGAETLFNSRAMRDEEEDSDSAAHNNNIRSHPYCKSVYTYRARHGSRQGSITLDSSTGSKDGSRMTSPDSLEWDFVDSSLPTIDQETEQLIAEIERLAENALQETGQYNVSADDEVPVLECS